MLMMLYTTNMDDILDEITETRIYCGFRENMMQVANGPCDVVALVWPICIDS